MTRILKTLIVIFADNNDNTLPIVVKAAMATGYDWLVIDAGSKNRSPRQIDEWQSRTMHLGNPKGKGATLLQGAEQAAKLGYDTIVAIDGSDQFAAADVQLLVERAQISPSPCVVIGAAQNFEKNAANFLVRLECGLELPDLESTFRLYPVKELLLQKFRRNNHGFAIESIVKLAWSGIEVVSIPVKVGKEQREEHNTLRKSLSLTFLHSRLFMRRLLPWPHKKLTEQEPLHKMVVGTLSRNPLKILRQICREHTSPLWLAIAVWLGIFMGALPLLTIHTIAIIYVAHRLHLNKVAAVAASQFCMPPVVPVLCIQMGYFLRKGEFLFDFSWQPWLLGIHERLWEWLIGSLLVGPVLGCIGAIAMYWTACRLQGRKLQNIEV